VEGSLWFLPLGFCSATEALSIGACLFSVCFYPPRYFEFDVFDCVWIPAHGVAGRALELPD
jgi:hypothetical protein